MERRVENAEAQSEVRNGTLSDVTFYSFVMDSLPVGILTVDRDMRITSFNPWAQTLTDYTEEEVLGRYCGEVLRGGRCGSDCPLKKSIHDRSPIVWIETTIRNKAGDTIPVRIHTSALTDKDGKLMGGVEAFQDMTRVKAMEREKDNIISMFAHDMKSSLTIIGGFVLRLLKKAMELDEETKAKYLEIIQKETGKLDFLINDFLEFARLQTGKLKLNLQAVSLDKELMELFEAYQSRAMQSGIDLEFRGDIILPVILADPNRLRRAFTNILDNAFKFSKKGDVIRIVPDLGEKEISVRIEDQGPGIPAEDLPFIFEAFYRGKKVEGKEEGVGLGLASAKSIVEAHGGRVTAESEFGKGSAFTIILPRTERLENR